ncbi:predicted protein [Naegleria gruberi]|uniref:Predicted protein n=1 Tax=Naegleria gruberi TaxID=5762 RepID=D2VHG3_NAEGR|nr:uncharacterized protein NAEGRDRAFT_58229 [Naegleria gruberi]EFC43583.1 predicted protein [Naegleria gruberi]|eukprot:XP_002676327.1 predicted protein [Naegleria gruberi strain NEG-M]
MVLDTSNPPVIINGAHTLVGCLTALAIARQFNQRVVLVSTHSEALLVNEAILINSKSAEKLCTLLETPLLQKVVQCRNIEGYAVHDLERGDCLIEFDSHSLYKAVMDKLTTKYLDMVKIVFGIGEPSVHFQVIPQVSTLKVPILKFVNKEGMTEEIISKFLFDCERKSFVVASMLHHSSSGLNLKQSSSSYMYQQLDIPENLYPFKESKYQVRIQENTTMMIVPKFLSNQFSTTFFFKIDPQLQYDQQMVALKMLEFLKSEFPFTFSLVTLENIYSWFSSHLETIQDYQVTASTTECIGFLNQSRIPHFGDYQFMEVFKFIKNLESLGIPTTKKIPAEDIKKSMTILEIDQFNSVKAIERTLHDYQVMKNTMWRFTGPVWNFLKIPVITAKQHLIDVFGRETSRMTTAQKWRYRFIYGLSAILLYKGASNWYHDRKVANDIIRKIGTENELCKKLIRRCVSGDCGSKTVSLMLQHDEGLNFLEINTLVNLLKDSSSRVEFLTQLVLSGNIKQLSGTQLSSLLKSANQFMEDDKYELLLKLYPYAQVSQHEIPLIVSNFDFLKYQDKARELLQPGSSNQSQSSGGGVLALAVLSVFFMLGLL